MDIVSNVCHSLLQEFKPHIFIVAEAAYRNVQGQVEPADQSLVVSGESGAGKVGLFISTGKSKMLLVYSTVMFQRDVWRSVYSEKYSANLDLFILIPVLYMFVT